jgi:hypothetical protein
MVSLVPVVSWAAAIVAALVALSRGPRTVPIAADRLARTLLFFAVGLESLWAALGHIFFPEMAARAIGWQTSPFQFEVGVANLGIAMAALYAAFRSHQAQLATALAALGFLGGAGVGHIRDILEAGNLAPGNAGPILFTDFLTPVAILVLIWLAHGNSAKAAAPA